MSFKVKPLQSYQLNMNLPKSTWGNSYRPDADAVNAMADVMQRNYTSSLDLQDKRSVLSRGFDVLLTPNYMTAGFARGMVNEDFNPIQGMVQGLKQGLSAFNPYSDYTKGKHSFTDFLEDSGWKPEGVMGKIAKGTTGFLLDVALDPTTYLTGGASALVKGTGRTADVATQLSKVADQIPQKVYENTLSKWKGKGLDEKTAVMRATREMNIMKKQLDSGITHMTDEIAEVIVQNHALTKARKLTPDEIAYESKHLAEQYNRLAGIRDVGDVTPIDFGLKNLPFMNQQRADKLGALGKTLHISDGASARAFGDKIGMANQYSKLRDSIYGSRLGELFSTKTGAYRLAKEDPAKLYELLHFQTVTKGLAKDKHAMEKAFREKAQLLGVHSKSEQAEILKHLQDKTIYGQVAKTIKFSESKKAKEIERIMKNAQKQTGDRINELTKGKNTLEQMKHAVENDIIKETKLYDEMRTEYRTQLKNMDLRHISDEKDMSKVVSALETEIKSIDEQMALLQKNNGVDVENFSKLADEAFGEGKLRDEAHKGIDDLRAQRVNMETLSGAERAEGTLHNQMINKQINEMRESVPKNVKKTQLMDTISEHVYGAKGKLSYNLQGKALDDLVNLMKKGESGENMLWHIEQHPEMYSQHFKAVASHIAKALNYAKYVKEGQPVRWQHVYKEPMEKLQKKINANPNSPVTDVLNPQELKQLFELNDLRLQRTELIHKYFNKMSYEDFMKMEADLQTERLIKELYEEINPRLNTHEKLGKDYETVRKKIYDHQSAGKIRPYTEFNEREQHELRAILSGRMYDDVMAQYLHTMSKRATKGSTGDGKMVVRNTEKEFGKDVMIGQEAREHTAKIVNEMAELIETNFPNRRYDELTRGQQALLIDMAHKKVYPSDLRKKMEKINQSQASIALQKEAQRRAGLERLQALEASVKEKSEVLFMANDRPYRGIVTSKVFDDLNGTELTVRTFDGETLNVPLREIRKVNQNSSMKSVDEIITENKTISTATKERQRLSSELDKIKKQLDESGNVYSVERKKAIDEYKVRLEEQQSLIRKYEDEGRRFQEAIKSTDDELITKLEPRMKELDDALASEQAFETWLKTHSQADVWAIRNPERYTRGIKIDTDGKLPEGWSAMTGADRTIYITGGEINKDALKKNFQYFHKELEAEGFTPERITKIFENNPQKLRQFVLEHELSHRRNKDWKKNNPGGDFSNPLTRAIELRANLDALKAIENFPDVATVMKRGMESGFGSTKAVEDMVTMLRDEFVKIGEYEVLIGKMSKGQFNAMMENYVPRIITEDGKHLLAKNKELTQKGSALSRDLGYGQKYNPYSKSRTIDAQKSIEEINDFFRSELKGKNFFADSISEIYLSRSLKHTELMYDNRYMNTMMEMFGSPVGDKVRDGYKGVANIGLLKREVQKQTKALIRQQHKGRMGAVTDDAWNEARNTILEKMQLDPRVLDDMAKPMVELSNDQIKAISHFNSNLPKEVSDTIVQKANQARILQIEKDQSQFLQMYDKFLHWTKLMQTTVMPAFHFRNKISNTFLNWLGVGADAVNPTIQKSAWHTSYHRGNPEKLDKLHDLVTPNGTVYKWSEIYDLAIQHKVIDEGFFAKDLGAGAQTEGLLKGKVKPKYDPTNTGSFGWFKAGAEWGGRIENQDRLIHFASALRQGKTIEHASDSARKHLFDYSDVTMFEARVMKRLIPYYTWLRKNGRLMASDVIDQPGKYRDSAKVMNGINNMNNQEDRMNPTFVGDWAEDWIQTPFEIGGRPVIANPFMPFMDVNRFPNPFNAQRSAKELFAQMAPHIKLPVELTANKNVYFDSDIQKEGQNPITPRLAHILKQLAPVQVGTGLAEKEGIDQGMYALSNLTGVKHMRYNYDANRARILDEAQKR